MKFLQHTHIFKSKWVMAVPFLLVSSFVKAVVCHSNLNAIIYKGRSNLLSYFRDRNPVICHDQASFQSLETLQTFESTGNHILCLLKYFIYKWGIITHRLTVEY